jgi:hypothetical protein
VSRTGGGAGFDEEGAPSGGRADVEEDGAVAGGQVTLVECGGEVVERVVGAEVAVSGEIVEAGFGDFDVEGVLVGVEGAEGEVLGEVAGYIGLVEVVAGEDLGVEGA